MVPQNGAILKKNTSAWRDFDEKYARVARCSRFSRAEINFSDFEKKSGMSPKLNPSNIRDISFAGYGRNFDVDLMIKEVSFF